MSLFKLLLQIECLSFTDGTDYDLPVTFMSTLVLELSCLVLNFVQDFPGLSLSLRQLTASHFSDLVSSKQLKPLAHFLLILYLASSFEVSGWPGMSGLNYSQSERYGSNLHGSSK